MIGLSKYYSSSLIKALPGQPVLRSLYDLLPLSLSVYPHLSTYASGLILVPPIPIDGSDLCRLPLESRND